MSTALLKEPALARNIATRQMIKERTGNFLVFILLAVSAIEYFYREQLFILAGAIISSLYMLKFNRKVTKSFFLIAFAFLVVEVLQYLLHGGFNFRTFTGTYIRLFLAYAVVTITGPDFFRYYTNVLYKLGIFSLILYGLSFVPGMEDFYMNTLADLIPPIEKEDGFYRAHSNIVFFTFHESLFEEHRNSGAFWEPGAYAVFLIIALLFNHPHSRKLNEKKNIVFILCLITTFSTAGYIAFFLFLLYYNFNLLRKNLLYVVTLLGLSAGVYTIYERTPFLKEKVSRNIELADETTTSRFGSALADFNTFKKSPLIGYGRAGAKTGFISASEFSVDNHRNNGVFDLLATYGLPLTILYFTLIYQTFLKGFWQTQKGIFAFAALLIVFILGFSQGLFLKPFFYAFLFLPFAPRSIIKHR